MMASMAMKRQFENSTQNTANRRFPKAQMVLSRSGCRTPQTTWFGEMILLGHELITIYF